MEAKEVLALIELIIEEHKLILQEFQALEKVANDAGAIIGLGKAKEAFVPGRFEQKQGLQELKKLVETSDEGLRAHFNREETRLMDAVAKHGGEELVSALRTLLNEHEELRNRLDESEKQIAYLTGSGISRHVWDAASYDMRAHISHTRKLLQAHTKMEQELLQKLRSLMLKEMEEEGKP